MDTNYAMYNVGECAYLYYGNRKRYYGVSVSVCLSVCGGFLG